MQVRGSRLLALSLLGLLGVLSVIGAVMPGPEWPFLGLTLQGLFAHIVFFLTGQVETVQGDWLLVALNVGLFLLFIFFLKARRSLDWTNISGIGIYAAFIVSLFVEMYGIPLTIFLTSSATGSGAGSEAILPTVWTATFLGTSLRMNVWMFAGVIITVIGMALVAVGWWQVYEAEGLVTDGLYAYSRNPQYVGIILIAFGWVVGWPTLLTLSLFPVLAYAYYRVARREQDDMIERYGEQYHEYAQAVPLLV